MSVPIKVIPRELVREVSRQMSLRGYSPLADSVIHSILSGEDHIIPGYFAHHTNAVRFVESFRPKGVN